MPAPLAFISRKHRRAKAFASIMFTRRLKKQESSRSLTVMNSIEENVALRQSTKSIRDKKTSGSSPPLGSSIFAMAPSDSEQDVNDAMLLRRSKKSKTLKKTSGSSPTLGRSVFAMAPSSDSDQDVNDIMHLRRSKKSKTEKKTSGSSPALGSSIFAMAPSDSEQDMNDGMLLDEEDLDESEEDEIMDLIANDEDDEDDWHYVETARSTSLLRPCLHSHTILTAEHIETLEREGLVVIDNAVFKTKLQEAFHDCKQLQTQGAFGESANENEDIRSDQVYYLTSNEREQQEREQKQLLGKKYIANKQSPMTGEEKGLLYAQGFLQGLGAVLEARGFKGFQCGRGRTSPSQPVVLKVPDPVQLAVYGRSGTRYTAHRDGAEDGTPGMYSLRAVTAILYLNDNSTPWDRSQHGGCLRCYMGADASDKIGSSARKLIDIDPVGGRLVLFSARAVLHEVMPTFRDRYAMTVWFLKDSPESKL